MKHGLGFLFIKKGLFKDDGSYEEMLSEAKNESLVPVGVRIRRACVQLGPTFVKLGQILSTRTDIVGETIASELAKLQDNVDPFPFEEAKKVLESEFSCKLTDIFEYFDEKPIASASVAQVYKAKLKSGMTVAVKVRRPGIKRVVEEDTRILLSIGKFMDKHTKYGKLFDFEGMVHEFTSVLRQELDFTIEANNADSLRENLKKTKGVSVPDIKWIYTTKRVLTMEFVTGDKISDVKSLKERNINTTQIANTFVDCLLMQILRDGFFQADPHPGNEIIREDGSICFIDMGSVGRLSESLRDILCSMLIGLSIKNSRKVTRALVEMGTSKYHINESALEKRVKKLFDEFLFVPLKDVSIMNVFTGLFSIAGEFKIKLPKEVTLVAKCLGTAQKIVDSLDPTTNMFSIAKKTTKDIVKDKINIKNVNSGTLSHAIDWYDAIKLIPNALSRFLNKAQDEDFTLDLRIKQLDNIEKKIDRFTNRMSFAVILLAVCLVLAGVVVAVGMISSKLAVSEAAETFKTASYGIIICLIIATALVVLIILSMFIAGRKK